MMDYMKAYKNVLDAFSLEGTIQEICPYGEGHINQTFLVTTSTKRYILQVMNTHVFSDPDSLMKNICYVTKHLESKGIETLHVVFTKRNEPFLKLEDNTCYRIYDFIENTVTFQKATDPQVFCNSGYAFGEFQNYLKEFDASVLTETIPNFHNTPIRVRNFLEAISKDVVSRAKECEKEIQFVLERKDTLNLVVEGLQDGSIPLRVTHNDTKLNNILMDADSLKARAVIDLDTIMSGSMLYDFGDSIRFGASTAAEDEKNLELVHFDRSLFEAYTRGYYAAVADSITPKEVELLPYSAYLLTMECGIRFLTDYLMGDVYFATKYKEHNLIRCRTQFKLAFEIYEALDELKCLVKRIQEEKK